MTDNEFKCDVCKGTFKKALTDEQAEEQFKKEFPVFKRAEDDGIVCDGCFKELFQ